MPAFETMDLYDDVVLWPAVGFDRHGNPTLGPPVDTKGRWNNKTKQVQDSKGNQVTISASVVTTRDIPMGSCLWLGTYEEFLGSDGSGSGASSVGIMEAITFDSTNDIKGRFSRKEIGLRMKGNNLYPSAS